MERKRLTIWLIIIAIAGAGGTLFGDSGPLVLVYTTRTATAELIRLEISRSRHEVGVYRGRDQIKIYPIAIGRSGWETPLGDYKVTQLVQNPPWQHPLTGRVYEPGEPGNELGHYWIGFLKNNNGVIGFHGTPHPETVGKSVSHGCVRMLEADIAELYSQVRLGTQVTVRP